MSTTYRTASALRNPLSTTAAGAAVLTGSAFVGIFKWTIIGTWLLVKWSALAVYFLVLAVVKGVALLVKLVQDRGTAPRHRRERDAGVWYPGTGVEPRESVLQ